MSGEPMDELLQTATTTAADDAPGLEQLRFVPQDALSATVEESGAAAVTAAPPQEQLPPELEAATSDAWRASPAAVEDEALTGDAVDARDFAEVIDTQLLLDVADAAAASGAEEATGESERLGGGAGDTESAGDVDAGAANDTQIRNDGNEAEAAESATEATSTEATLENATPEAATVDAAPEAATVDAAPEAATVDAAPEAATVDAAPEAATVDAASEAATVDAASEAATVDAASEAVAAEEAQDVEMEENEHQQNDSAVAEATPDVAMTVSEQQHGDSDGNHAEPTEAAAEGSQADDSEHATEKHDPASPSHDEKNTYDPAANLLPHAQDEYDPADSSYERHGSDEYDPANPSAFNGEGEYDPENPAYEQGEYDPSAPSYDRDGAHGSPNSADPTGQPDLVHKRKSAATSDEHKSETERDAKRQRSDSHDSSRSLDGKARRDSDAQGEDKKGLSDAAWDRLKDFQTLGEFQINQVSRAAFASVGSLPEFAQVSIISRFTRVPLKGVRDKNGQLMRIHHEYLKENPHVAALQPVSAFVADYTSDPGLFEFGYAPPFPVNGMSTAPVPYQKEDTTTQQHASRALTTSRSSPASATTAVSSPSVDEFGRTIKKGDPTSPRPILSSSSSEQVARATDPRKALAQERADEAPPQAVAGDRGNDSAASSARKPFDPRRRLAGDNESSAAAVSDPRRAPAPGAGARAGGEIPTTTQPGDPRRRNLAPSGPSLSQAAPVKSELYDRLPLSVRSVLDTMVREGRLRESINDNVISRLNHLPEHVALRAVENFSNVDLTHIDNLQGFLVGIINRVNEKAIAAERTEASRAGGMAGGGYGNDSGAVLGYPGGAADRHTGRQGMFNRDQTESYRSNAPAGMNGGAGGYSQQYGPSSGMRASSLNVVPATGLLPPQQQQQPLSMHSGGGHYQQHHYQQPQQQHQSQYGIHSLPLSVQQRLRSLVATGALTSVDELSDKCYEVLSQLSEGLANEVITRFMNANLTTVRNRSGFLIGVVKRCRQEYGFN